ncbi:STAS domain-containing protein [Niveispirillum sp.]|uniref:STAS domain-containing protein n=1 Tax=Niveispirillum sp. TaxID=1917217 RepID=UPI001B56DCCF|nr:STAS domain-containing protein [Niveispirillum sp.]MBP7339469.1 STAS domain-containing protein [Niveispirillum sp.]
MDIAEERVDGIQVLAPAGRLDGNSSKMLDDRLAAIPGDCKALVLDLGSLDYVSSAGLRVLLKQAKQAKASGSKLALCSLHPNVQEVFDISGFTSLFTIKADRAAALAALG